ncbi:hypothetical protein Tco_1556024 [Tanacetum coccineum]
MSIPTFAATHNLVAFLEKLVESEGFEQIIDFLNASHVKYALTVNPTIYTSCMKQFWAMAKDAKGSTCLPNATILEELARMGAKSTAWNEFSSTMASAIICLANNQKFNFSKYILDNLVKNLEGGGKFYMFPRFVQLFLNKQVEGLNRHKETYVVSSLSKKIFANMRRQVDDFSGNITPLFDTMMVQVSVEGGEDSDHSADSDQTPIDDQPSTSSQPQKKLNQGEDRGRKQRTILQERVLVLQKAKDAQAKEIATLKKTVKKLQRKRRSKHVGLRKLKKIGAKKSKSFKATNSLGDQEDSSKQGRRIEAIDEVTLKAQKEDEDLMFNTSVLEEDKVVEDEVVAEHAKEPEVVTTVSGPSTTTDELTLAQTLNEIAKSKKVEAITTAATSVTTTAETRPKVKGIVFHEIEQTHRPIISSQPSSKDKVKVMTSNSI